VNQVIHQHEPNLNGVKVILGLRSDRGLFRHGSSSACGTAAGAAHQGTGENDL